MSKQKIGEERQHIVPHAWIFDVDGVITNPKEKKVTEVGLIDAIADRLKNGEIVTLNTGRSLSWMMDRVIKPIEESVGDKRSLDKFLAVGEKGGALLSFQNGEWVTYIDERISVPESLQTYIRGLIDAEFQDSMFYDESKLTMISTEMVDGHSIPDFTQKQHALVSRMQEILAKTEYQNLDLKIDPTTIATDIQNTHVGKHLGARRIEDWLKDKNIKPQHILTIGDSQSDTEMAEELQDEYSVDFVFVGEPSKLNSDKLKNNPIFTVKRFCEGTLEFLQTTN
jgi:hydroxymethylpyrimidine pyrophosphatase-like HAD family hydrolase